MIAQFAKNEQNMNAVERVLHYSELPPEGDATTADDPPPSWPEKGQIQFTHVDLAYREDLPLVLKDVNFQVGAGEKVIYILAPVTSALHISFLGRNRRTYRFRFVYFFQ